MAHTTTMTIISLILFVAIFRTHAKMTIKLDDWDTQGQKARDGEMERTNNDDLQFLLEITTTIDRPIRKKKAILPVAKDVMRLYEQEKERLMAEAARAKDDLFRNATVSIQRSYAFKTLISMRKHQWKYCPITQNYQCGSKEVILPCFYGYYNGAWEWCCSFWPKVTFHTCNCCQCAILTSTCVFLGECRPRYSKKSFLAVCYRHNQWLILRYIIKYLPTSCYCRI